MSARRSARPARSNRDSASASLRHTRLKDSPDLCARADSSAGLAPASSGVAPGSAQLAVRAGHPAVSPRRWPPQPSPKPCRWAMRAIPRLWPRRGGGGATPVGRPATARHPPGWASRLEAGRSRPPPQPRPSRPRSPPKNRPPRPRRRRVRRTDLMNVLELPGLLENVKSSIDAHHERMRLLGPRHREDRVRRMERRLGRPAWGLEVDPRPVAEPRDPRAVERDRPLSRTSDGAGRPSKSPRNRRAEPSAEIATRSPDPGHGTNRDRGGATIDGDSEVGRRAGRRRSRRTGSGSRRADRRSGRTRPADGRWPGRPPAAWALALPRGEPGPTRPTRRPRCRPRWRSGPAQRRDRADWAFARRRSDARHGVARRASRPRSRRPGSAGPGSPAIPHRPRRSARPATAGRDGSADGFETATPADRRPSRPARAASGRPPQPATKRIAAQAGTEPDGPGRIKAGRPGTAGASRSPGRGIPGGRGARVGDDDQLGPGDRPGQGTRFLGPGDQGIVGPGHYQGRHRDPPEVGSAIRAGGHPPHGPGHPGGGGRSMVGESARRPRADVPA